MYIWSLNDSVYIVMKLAVILFGHYRTFDKHVDYWRGGDADFYISTWDTLDSTSKTWYKEESPEVFITTDQIQTLKSFDPNCHIGRQEWTSSEMEDTFGKMPFKSILYKYECIVKSVKRILDSKIQYDTVLITRPDIRIYNIGKLNPVSGEIFISYRKDSNFLRGLSGTELLYAIHFTDIEKLANIPNTLLEWKVEPKKYKYAEEHFTDYIFQTWNTVCQSYEYYSDVIIIRL